MIIFRVFASVDPILCVPISHLKFLLNDDNRKVFFSKRRERDKERQKCIFPKCSLSTGRYKKKSGKKTSLYPNKDKESVDGGDVSWVLLLLVIDRYVSTIVTSPAAVCRQFFETTRNLGLIFKNVN